MASFREMRRAAAAAQRRADSERQVVATFPAGGPHGSWPAEARARKLREQGQPAMVRMDLDRDAFLVIVEGGDES